MNSTEDIANRALITVQTTLAWKKPSRELIENLLGANLSCKEKVGYWTECVSDHSADLAIEACRYVEYLRASDRAAAISLRFAVSSQPLVADFATLERTLGRWVPGTDSLPSGAGVDLAEFPIYYRTFPRSGRAAVSLQHYRDGRVHSIHIEWSP